MLAGVTDRLLEATVVGSFSRLGFALRSRMEAWGPMQRLDGKVFVVTGASSGIGRAVALGLARQGAGLVLLGRDAERLGETRRGALADVGASDVRVASLDLVNSDEVRLFAANLAASEDRLDGVIHCAGALFGTYRAAPDGTELTLATHVLAPFRLTGLLAPLLRLASSSIVVTMSSGGMYTQRFELDRLELTARNYRGTTAYARAKRAQVILAREWARRWSSDGIDSYAMHPGWVDTPGLSRGLPSFARLGPLLRTPSQGADTAVWLSTGPSSAKSQSIGGIWLDRHRRSEQLSPDDVPQRSQSPARRPGPLGVV